MVRRRLASAKFALAVAVGCAQILEPILDFVDRVNPRSPVLDAAVAVVLVVLPLTYVVGLVLLYIHVSTQEPAPAVAAAAAAAPAPPGAPSRLAAVACTLASMLLVAVVAFLLLLVLGGSPPTDGSGLTPTMHVS